MNIDTLAEVRRLRGEGLDLDEAFAEVRRLHPAPSRPEVTVDESLSVLSDTPDIIDAKRAVGLTRYDEVQICHLAEIITLWTMEDA